MNLRNIATGAFLLALAACSTTSEQGTLAQLERVPADVEEVYVADSLERAAESYRRYLEETPRSARTPEAMRRLADLQIEQAYGVIGAGDTAMDCARVAKRLSRGDVTLVYRRTVDQMPADREEIRHLLEAGSDLAREYRLDGVSLWAFGFDDDDVWTAILPTVADPAATTTLPE